MHSRLRIMYLREDRAAAFEVATALVGEVDAAGGPVEERCAELAFEESQRPHHRGQGYAEISRRRRQAAPIDDADEARHGAELVHFDYSTECSSLMRDVVFIQHERRGRTTRRQSCESCQSSWRCRSAKRQLSFVRRPRP